MASSFSYQLKGNACLFVKRHYSLEHLFSIKHSAKHITVHVKK